MMNELDKKVLELFRFLLNSGTKYLDHVDYTNGSLVYIIDSKLISLNPHKAYAEKELKPNSYSTVEYLSKTFEFDGCINPEFKEREIRYDITLEGKWYRVPKLNRIEQAQALDRIDAILEEKESEILDSTLNEFTADSREEL